MKKKEISDKYYDYVITHKKAPKKLKKFLSHIDLSKEDFLIKFNGFEEVEQYAWKRALKDTLKSLKNSAEYIHYSSRDRGLAFMHSWFECMANNKEFFSQCKFSKTGSDKVCGELKGFKKELKKFIGELIDFGMTRGEFQNRGIQSKMISHYFWSLFHLNLSSWKRGLKKNSKKQDAWMDAMIEKSMVFFFDSLAPNLFDTFLDMLKHKRSKK